MIFNRISASGLLFIFTLVLWSKPVIEFESLKYDYGKIKEEAGPHDCKFIFSNTGDEPLKIDKVKAG